MTKEQNPEVYGCIFEQHKANNRAGQCKDTDKNNDYMCWLKTMQSADFEFIRHYDIPQNNLVKDRQEEAPYHDVRDELHCSADMDTGKSIPVKETSCDSLQEQEQQARFKHKGRILIQRAAMVRCTSTHRVPK